MSKINTVDEITQKLKEEVFLMDKQEKENRFEWIHTTDNHIYLIDNKNELIGIPVTMKYDQLLIEDLEAMKKWINHLNEVLDDVD